MRPFYREEMASSLCVAKSSTTTSCIDCRSSRTETRAGYACKLLRYPDLKNSTFEPEISLVLSSFRSANLRARAPDNIVLSKATFYFAHPPTPCAHPFSFMLPPFPAHSTSNLDPCPDMLPTSTAAPSGPLSSTTTSKACPGRATSSRARSTSAR